MTTWTTPAHGNPSSSIWNAQVADNLGFLRDGNLLYLPTPSEDLTATPKAQGIKNGAYLVPVMNKDTGTLMSMGYRSDTANGHVDLGVYLDDGNGTTCSKISTTGLTPMPGGSGAKQISLALPAPVVGYQKYWLVIGFAVISGSGSVGTVLGTNGVTAALCKRALNVMPLPTVITFDTTAPGVAPCLAAFP